LAECFCEIENQAFINGDGNNKPNGMLVNNDIVAVKAQADQEISIEDILNLINELHQGYHANAAFLMHRTTLSYIQTLKDEAGRFIWQPSYTQKSPQTLFGINLYCCEQMPVIGEGKKVIALGDFKRGYKIVDRSQISIMRDCYTNKPFVKFYTTKRVGGDVVDSAAIKFLQV
jgi:HK97 family phage major capsid protein